MKKLLILLLFCQFSFGQYNLFARQNFAGRAVAPVTTNTEIGGVASTISTPALLAAKLGILESRISNFSIVGSDIQCRITGSYGIPVSAFANNSNLTYFTDLEGVVTSLGASSFSNQTTTNVLKSVYFPNATFIGNSCFYTANFGSPTMDYIYIPRCISLGTSVGIDGVFSNDGNPILRLYIHPSLAINNSGLPDGDLTANNKTVNIRYVTNFTTPNPVTDLSAGTIYNTAIQLNFTPPSSTNTIDYYECWANGSKKNNITSSGEYVMGLNASTSYSVTLVAVDIFYNKAVASNVLVSSTNTTSAVPTSGLVSYYKLDETSGSIAYDSFSTENLTNTGITINQAGKVGNSYLSTSTAQKLQTVSATSITGNFSLNSWVKRTAATGTYGGIIEQGDYTANTGFAIWIEATNNVLFRINQTFNFPSSLFNLTLNEWVMITIVYDGSTIKRYRNGVLVLTNSHTTNPTASNLRKMFAGFSDNMFFGNIDEASVYNSALTQSQIQLIYNNGIGTTL